MENFQGENSYVLFFMSYKLEFIFFIKIQIKILRKQRNFRKENDFSNEKFLENFGKCDALGPSKPFKEYDVYKFSARLLKNSSRNMG